MKKIKRLMALLLTGVMALSILTGCAAAIGENYVDAVMDAVNQNGQHLRNDLGLRRELKRYLHKIDSHGEIEAKYVGYTEVNGAETTHYYILVNMLDDVDAAKQPAIDFADKANGSYLELLPMLVKSTIGRCNTTAVAITYYAVGEHLYIGCAFTENCAANT